MRKPRLGMALAGAVLAAVALVAVEPAAEHAVADGPGNGAPYIVSLGDSAISGEGGRWAGNANGSSNKSDALGEKAYHDGGFPGAITGLSNKCVDVQGGSSANGTPIWLYPCNGTAAQSWTIHTSPNSGNLGVDGTIRALGKCLDVTNGSTAALTPVQLYDCNGTGAQIWQELPDGAHILNPQSGKCLGVNPVLNGDFRLRIETCEYNWPISSEQIWHLPDSYEQIRGCHRSRSAAVYIGGGVNGVNFACSGARTNTVQSNNEGNFKPGIDFTTTPPGLPSNHKGQALLLQEFAATHNVKAVSLLIGANNLGYSAILKSCITKWYVSQVDVFSGRHYCHTDSDLTNRFTASALATLKADIKTAINNTRQAMQNAGYSNQQWTLLVDTYWVPIPGASGFRYSESTWERGESGCAAWDQDADWAVSTAVPALNGAVRSAVQELNHPNVRLVDMQGIGTGHALCQNGVGTMEEKGVTYWTNPGAADVSEWFTQMRVSQEIRDALPGFLPAGPWDNSDYDDYQTQEGGHANYWGQLAMRNCLRQAYNNGSPVGIECWPTWGGGLNGRSEPNVSQVPPVPPPHPVASLHCDPGLSTYSCDVQNVGTGPYTTIRWSVRTNTGTVQKGAWDDQEHVSSACTANKKYTVTVELNNAQNLKSTKSVDVTCGDNP
ncbi:ricin-type beta-trefoil lectin domain protein [Streptosporangiaceae bacterium NEAU-GS5]|nr:ricin-type beta-trefoil lectin domain protein [Streptosporangiaceae bacterium NEAU-GS5]